MQGIAGIHNTKNSFDIFQIFLNGFVNRIVLVKNPAYTAIPADAAVEENTAYRELRDRAGAGADPARDDPLPRSPTMAIEKTLDEIRLYLRYLAAKAEIPEKSAPHRELVLNEWHQVALVIDRWLFAILFFVSFVVTIALYGHS